MSLLPCRRCGRTDPRHMIGLMTLWFGRFVEMPTEGGYFYLCPACYDELVASHIDDVRRQVLDFHPHLRKHMEARAAQAEHMATEDAAREHAAETRAQAAEARAHGAEVRAHAAEVRVHAAEARPDAADAPAPGTLPAADRTPTRNDSGSS